MTESGPPSDRPAPGVVLDVPADTSELTVVRREVRRFVTGAGGDAFVADDFELVVSELATNVIEHTSSPRLTIRMGRTAEDWILDVADVDDVHILDHVSLPDHRQLTGRGLFVVASLVDELAVIDDGDRHAVRCWRRVAMP